MAYIKINCAYCTIEFEKEIKYILRAKRENRKLYCSKGCGYKSNSKHKENSLCLNCSKPLNKNQFKFCSHSCSALYNNNRLGTGDPTKKKRYPDKRNSCLYCKKPVNATYCNNTCYANFKLTEALNNKTKVGHVSIKRFLLEKKGKVCWVCNNVEWNNQPITLEIDHIDGDSSNNSLENVRILCPNCHSQTPTYKFKNKGRGRFNRMKRYRNGQSC